MRVAVSIGWSHEYVDSGGGIRLSLIQAIAMPVLTLRAKAGQGSHLHAKVNKLSMCRCRESVAINAEVLLFATPRRNRCRRTPLKETLMIIESRRHALAQARRLFSEQ